MPAPYRVVQWGTGNLGAEALRAILAQPDLELAGVFVYCAGKDGLDAGALCGAAPTGVRATRDRSEILALAAERANWSLYGSPHITFGNMRFGRAPAEATLGARGTVCGQRYVWAGFIDGRAAIEIEALWTVGPNYPEKWPRPKDGWTVTIEGEPSVRAHFTSAASFAHAREHSIAEHVHAADVATAMQAVNAIAPLCEAAPGLRTFLDLPLVRGRFALAP